MYRFVVGGEQPFAIKLTDNTTLPFMVFTGISTAVMSCE